MANVSPPPDNSFFEEFLDDFFAECDEHLTAVRRDLLALEPFVGQVDVDRPLLDELFRSFHSLKGLAGMVGISDIEQVAHHTESYFRAVRDKQVVVTTPALDVLFAAAQLMEQVLAAWKLKQPGPSIAPIVAAFNALLPAESGERPTTALVATPVVDNSPPLIEPAAPPIPAVRSVRFVFMPTAALAERGVNVNSIRARLQAIGELQKATPQVRPEGGVAFEFVVATDAAAATFEPWAPDGLEWQVEEQNGAAQSPADAAVPVGRAMSVTSANVVRVDLARLDDLMQMIGELVITRARLSDRLTHLEDQVEVGAWRDLQDVNLLLARQLRDLREGVVRARMVSVGDVFARMQFVVRDLARDLRKQVRLELHGQHTEIDKHVVERLVDPLVHLVRNAVDHGLETPADRVASGKPPEGTLTLTAAAAGDVVTIELADDGRGIDREQLHVRARERGLPVGAEPLDNGQILDVLCPPGFSTREHADRVSGRGVGMDVVQQTVQQLGGTLSLTTEVGRGTRFTIQVPLTLTIVDALIISTGQQTFAMPLPAVREAISIMPDAITTLESNELLRYREQVLPLVRLARVFGLPGQAEAAAYGLVIGHGTMRWLSLWIGCSTNVRLWYGRSWIHWRKRWASVGRRSLVMGGLS